MSIGNLRRSFFLFDVGLSGLCSLRSFASSRQLRERGLFLSKVYAACVVMFSLLP